MMKKILFCIVAACAVVLSGCEKEPKAPDSLDGTVWEMTYSDSGYSTSVTLSFYKDTYLSEVVIVEDGMSDTGSFLGAYTYVAPNVTLIDEDETLSGVVKGDELTFNDYGDVNVFKRL